MKPDYRSLFYVCPLLLLVLVACTTNSEPTIQSTPILAKDTPIPTLAATPYPEPATLEPNTPSPESANRVTETPSATPVPALWIADYVPDTVVDHVMAQIGDQVVIAEDKQTATWYLEIGDKEPFAIWVYALVAPFPTIVDQVSAADFRQAWGDTLETGPFAGSPLMMDRDTYEVFAQFWGEAPTGNIQIVAPDDLIQTTWEQQPSWAIVPFEHLDPQWKVLKIVNVFPSSPEMIDVGISPIQKDFDIQNYALVADFSLTGQGAPPITPISNYDPNKMTDIMLTGVTALVRGTALTMERKGVTYPGEDILPLTSAVDFMHVNNEIPFTPDCPFPELYPEKLVFCSDVRYLELLEYIGTDIVEVSGDHFGDHGPEGTLFTLDLYDEVGLPYYGGGRDLADGRQALLLEHNGNRIAMIGCNAKGSEYYAPADEDTPGAVPCDFEWLETEIARLRAAGYLVIMTFQHVEYYSYEAQPDLVRDFGRAAAAGASIVSGSQSHQAHGFAFQDGAFIHYGLGNLFFDQYLFCENANCDYGFMDRHVIYEGRHISTEVIPIRFIDMARPRPMTAEEKAWFLGIIFEASGWQVPNN